MCITYLQQYEPKVPNIGYAGYTKFVCGIVLKIHDANYFASISSNTKKFRISFAIKNSMGYPFECTVVVYVPGHSVLSELNFEQIRKTDETYWRLLEIERRYCRKHAEQIHELAYKVYKIGCNSNHVLYHTSCDFTLVDKDM